MDESRIKAGTKIKIIAAPNSSYCKIGDIGTIVTDSFYHSGEVRDRDGYYWADFKHSEHPRICFTSDTSIFKILKY